MIITEIYVPALDKSYDFKINEDILTAFVIEEIVSVICQREQCSLSGNKGDIMLFKKENSQVLSMGLSLYENGIKTGDKLLLA